MAKGQCFICHKHRHLVKDCFKTKGTRINKVKEKNDTGLEKDDDSSIN